MSGGAQLSVTDLRRTTRHPVNLPVIAEHRNLGDVMLQIINISTTGFMVVDMRDLERGERLTIRLPHIGRIEAFLVWTANEKAGFQFERILRNDDFVKLVKALQPTKRPSLRH